MRSILLTVFFLFLGPTLLFGQGDNYNIEDFDIADDDLNTFDMGSGSSGKAEPGDFPAAADDSFDYGGVDNFTNEETGLNEDKGAGLINFGDNEEVGKQIDPPAKKKNGKKSKAANADTTKKDGPPAPDSAADTSLDGTPPTATDSLDSGAVDSVGGDVPAINEIGLTGNAAPANASASGQQETPYAPLPEDTMAPPAPQLPEPNEFAGAPAVPGTRRIMAIGEAPQTYRVRAGDTLFDICDQLLDEPNYWPKLWALNPEIRNPHFIYPGIMLRFYPGDDEMPPYLEVVKEQDIVPIENEGVGQGELISADVDALLLEQYVPKVSTVEDGDRTDLESFNLEERGVPSRGETVSVVVPAFYFENEVESLGEVAGNREGWNLSGDGEYFLIETESGLSPGTIYTIVRPSEIPDIYQFDGDAGYRYEFVAAAKVTRSLEDDYAEATVVYTRLGVKAGDLVVNYKTFKRSLNIMNAGVSGSGVGTVIGFEHPEQELGGQGSLVFLSGSFTVNSVVPIFNDVRGLTHNHFAKDYPETIRPVATVRIIESSPIATLGYIMNNTRAVRLGDFSGKG